MYEIELTDREKGKGLCVSSDGVYVSPDAENSPIRMTLDASGCPSLLTVETIESTVDLSNYAPLDHTHVVNDITDFPLIPAATQSAAVWEGSASNVSFIMPVGSVAFFTGLKTLKSTGVSYPFYTIVGSDAAFLLYWNGTTFAKSASSGFNLYPVTGGVQVTLYAGAWLNTSALYQYYATFQGIL